MEKNELKNKKIKCICGCGNFTKIHKDGKINKFVNGHNRPWRNKRFSDKHKINIGLGNKGKRKDKTYASIDKTLIQSQYKVTNEQTGRRAQRIF